LDAERAKLADPEHGAVLVKPFAVEELVATVGRLAKSAGEKAQRTTGATDRHGPHSRFLTGST
jgi:DNA-binding response OmpR family regulator